jgi:hypothetical protein
MSVNQVGKPTGIRTRAGQCAPKIRSLQGRTWNVNFLASNRRVRRSPPQLTPGPTHGFMRRQSPAAHPVFTSSVRRRSQTTCPWISTGKPLSTTGSPFHSSNYFRWRVQLNPGLRAQRETCHRRFGCPDRWPHGEAQPFSVAKVFRPGNPGPPRPPAPFTGLLLPALAIASDTKRSR